MPSDDDLDKSLEKEIAEELRKDFGLDDADLAINTELKKDELDLFEPSRIWAGGIVIKDKDRAAHTHIPGITRFGKSRFMELNMRQDILDGKGFLLIDPDGSNIPRLLQFCAKQNVRKVCLIDPMGFPVKDGVAFTAFDPFKKQPGESDYHRAGLIADALSAAWQEDVSKTPTLARYLPAMFESLIACNASLAHIEDFFFAGNDPEKYIRKMDADDDLSVLYCLKILHGLYEHKRTQRGFSALNWEKIRPALESAQNRTRFASIPHLARMFIQKEKSIDLPKLLDDGFVILVNLSGEGWAGRELETRLLGSLILNCLFEAEGDEKNPFYCYIDEVGFFSTEKLSQVLSLKGKKGLVLYVAHQFLKQLEHSRDFKDAVTNNCANTVCFHFKDPNDAQFMARIIYDEPTGMATEIRNLEKGWAIFKIGNELPVKAQVWYVDDLEEQDLDSYLQSLYDEYKDRFYFMLGGSDSAFEVAEDIPPFKPLGTYRYKVDLGNKPKPPKGFSGFKKKQ